jgi:arylamine N-acetyltransferase
LFGDITTIEKILYGCFEKEPFQNFYQLNNIVPTTFEFGGTCSDKSLSFYHKLKKIGYDVHLHSSWINEQEIHRVIRINLNNLSFLADVGNGWPSIHLYPLHEEVSYKAFGMEFQSRLLNDKIQVFHTNDGKTSLLFESYFKCKPENEIMDDIRNRFSRGIHYPFNGKIRFSQIVNGKFLFLKDDRLRIYADFGYKEITGIKPNEISTIIRNYFNFDLEKFELLTTIRI